MAEFTVHGPFEIPVVHEVSARIIDHNNIEERFWSVNECGSRRGCYVFGLRTSSGIIPFYVGKTVIGFEAECFQAHKMVKYLEAIAKRRKGTPIMFFVCTEGPGVYEHAIARLEEQLIGLAVARNDELQNIVGTNDEPIIIRGVLGHGKGRASEVALKFKKMLGIRDVGRRDKEDVSGSNDDSPHPVVPTAPTVMTSDKTTAHEPLAK